MPSLTLKKENGRKMGNSPDTAMDYCWRVILPPHATSAGNATLLLVTLKCCVRTCTALKAMRLKPLVSCLTIDVIANRLIVAPNCFRFTHTTDFVSVILYMIDGSAD